ncbi:DnaJ domain-containing protein [Eubacteriales bacterium OttesenSCG-928-G02]|nr:DnaJ domain-containing protein [Eubacteriales bacterium OttesenSCG-928-G02]
MTDPYKVLEILPTATDEEVKKAYRELAKKYHPDNYVNNPLADLAADKMKEINEAYEEIQKQRKNGTAANGTHTSNGQAAGYYRIRELINQGRFSEAEVLLQRDINKQNPAEWNFLYGIIYSHKGWLHDARTKFEEACRLDPNNNEYREALLRMSQGADNSPYNGNGRTVGCSGCDICTGLMCLNCLCDCCR